ncbi:MAG: hypothetical protein HYX87_08585 [Chloroflexi bacterium]|nr:hypothetical protein [Chloroflexota bacterium]
MKVFTGIQADNRKEATSLALRTAGMAKVRPYILDMFAAMVVTDSGNEAVKAVNSAIRSKYGAKSARQIDRWHIPIPELRYQGKDCPRLDIEVKTFLVATASVPSAKGHILVTLAGATGKPELLSIPMVFLHALLDNDLGRFPIVARDVGCTTWEVPGCKTVRLPNGFVGDLSQALSWQPVVSWLLDFGSQGRYVAPLVAGSLFGLLLQGSTQQPAPAPRSWSVEELRGALSGLGFRHTEVQRMVDAVMPRCRPEITLEEAVRLALQPAAEGANYAQ